MYIDNQQVYNYPYVYVRTYTSGSNCTYSSVHTYFVQYYSSVASEFQYIVTSPVSKSRVFEEESDVSTLALEESLCCCCCCCCALVILYYLSSVVPAGTI